MTSNAEIIATIEQGTAEVQRVFGPLSETHWQTCVHPGADGWTAQAVLAHLAARRGVHERLLRRAAEDSAPLTGGTALDGWNQVLVDERRGQSRDELLAEFQAVQDTLIVQVAALSEAQLALPVTLPQGDERALGEVVALAGGVHASRHAQEVAQALAAAPEP